MAASFEWNPEKAAQNYADHGVTFERRLVSSPTLSAASLMILVIREEKKGLY
jgi:hypothetical protein